MCEDLEGCQAYKIVAKVTVRDIFYDDMLPRQVLVLLVKKQRRESLYLSNRYGSL
jgi:hypothetical protein